MSISKGQSKGKGQWNEGKRSQKTEERRRKCDV